MVWQVKKIITILVAGLITAAAFCGSVSAATYNTYEGNISSTQLTYFRDILSGTSILDNYVCFRDGQYSYQMVVGKLTFNNGVFTLDEPGRIYTLDTNGSSYNNYYTYSNATLNDLTLNTSNRIVYSDLGDYPQLEERGQRYEILQTILIVICCVCFIVRNIFYYRKR